MTEMAEDGRWHMYLIGQARGFHLRFVKVQNFDVLQSPGKDCVVNTSTRTTSSFPGAESQPTVHMICVPDVVGEVPAIMHTDCLSQSIFQNAHHILCEFDETNFPSTDVIFEYDYDGTKFVEIYAAWKAAGGSPDVCCCVAKCKKTPGLVGIGMASVKGNRLKAAKLSLAVTLGLSHKNLEAIAAGECYSEIREWLVSVRLLREAPRKRCQFDDKDF